MSCESYLTFAAVGFQKTLDIFRNRERFGSSKIMRISIFGFLLTLVLTLAMPANSYALDKNQGVKWELIYLSPYGGCTNYQYQMANEYDEITSKYFDSYKFENSKYQAQCMSDKKYESYKVPSDVDLLVLVYDNEIGKRELRSNEVNGLFNHVGTDRTTNSSIIICDCSNFGFSTPVWVLSHELSHFVTYYLGFDLKVVEDQIESTDAKYEKCTEVHYDNNTCSGIGLDIRGDYYFTHAQVMTPYGPAIGKSLFSSEPKTNSTISNNDTSSNSAIHNNMTNDITTSPVVLGVQKEITKWWLEGKINDTDYEKVMGHLVGNSGTVSVSGKLPDNVIFFEGPDGKILDSTIYDNGSDTNPRDSILLKRIPFKPQNTTVTEHIQIPKWFKSGADSWLQNHGWTNQDYVNGMKNLFGNQTGR